MVRAERDARAYHHGNLRQALIEAGVQLARTGGPNAVVLRAASREAGVSHNAAYRHFANHEDLIAAVAQRCMTQLSLLMIERMSQVKTRDRARRAEARLEAIGRAYIEFARTEAGWFRTAFSSAQAHAAVPPPPHTMPAHTMPADITSSESPADVTSAEPLPNPYDVLRAALDELVEAGVLTAERRDGAEYPAWSGVHGLSSLLLDGPLHALPEPEIERAIRTVLDTVRRGLA